MSIHPLPACEHTNLCYSSYCSNKEDDDDDDDDAPLPPPPQFSPAVEAYIRNTTSSMLSSPEPLSPSATTAPYRRSPCTDHGSQSFFQSSLSSRLPGVGTPIIRFQLGDSLNPLPLRLRIVEEEREHEQEDELAGPSHLHGYPRPVDTGAARLGARRRVLTTYRTMRRNHYRAVHMRHRIRTAASHHAGSIVVPRSASICQPSSRQ